MSKKEAHAAASPAAEAVSEDARPFQRPYPPLATDVLVPPSAGPVILAC